MTGFGRGEATRKSIKAVVEVSSVNRKQFETVVSLPREYEGLESRIKDEVNRQVARGRVSIKVKYIVHEDVAVYQVRTNHGLARAYYQCFQELAGELGLDSKPSLETVIRLPGIFQLQEAEMDLDEIWAVTREALKEAMEGLQNMRSKEGKHLAQELKTRITGMRRSLKTVLKRAPEVLKSHRAQLEKRIQAAGVELAGAEDERILKEVVLFSDRSDITEEMIRLESHFKQFDETLKAGEPVGRKLDFLAQEIFREINTIGSKGNDSQISYEVVFLKTELEKFREQVQNVE